ncbi:hypothetical protein LHJ74_07565 [Streptomyces sp. N2-109]|uniref:AG2 protein n=1 Tax=Streptomyces gossypii TaxID=2883101 RepID=A0ABT2JPI2_9ACTN|nr:hypothetical protein [Streptomyces gossypii]MCT2589776.1 hypothetical protein [Streptomyces gossypii]
MVSYSDLEHLRLGKLKKAAEQWQQMAEKLDKVANGGKDGGASAADLESKAKGADWKGDNASVTKAFVTKATGEFDDLVTSARSIHTILNGAHLDFEQHKEDLKEAVERARKKNVVIDPQGVARPSMCYVNPDDGPTQAEIDTAAEDVGEVLRAAAITDSKAAGALRYHAKSKYDFREHGFKNFDGSVQVILDAEKYQKLAEQKPENISNGELQRMVELGRKYKGNEIFAETVATELGARGSLGMYAGLADKDNFGDHPADRRMELLADLEKTYGTTLATATRSDSTAMEKWERQVIALGGKEVGYDNGNPKTRVYGFQAMSNLMRHGKYETNFLTKYGDELIAFEKENTGDVPIPGPRAGDRENVLPWDENPLWARNNLMHFGDENDAGTDPMTGYMKALSHNPDASTQFFDPGKDRMEYMLDTRPDYNDVPTGYGSDRDDYDGPSARMNATGDALFAATSGMTPGDDSPPAASHSEAQGQIMKDAINVLGPQGDDMPSELRDSMAKVMTNQGDVVHDAMSTVDGSSPINEDNLMEVTKQVSRDPETYRLLNDGMNYAMVADMNSDTDYPDDKQHPEDSLNRAGYTLGFMEEARHQAIGDWSKEELTEAGWKKKMFDSGALIASEYVPGIPLPGEGNKIGLGTPLFAGATVASQAWIEGEQERIGEEANKQYESTYEARKGQAQKLADQWYSVNEGWAEGRTDFSPGRGIYQRIDSAANDGNDRFEGGTGDQG